MKSNMAFGDCDYSQEELVAELGAAYLSAFAGIQNETIENSTAYIQGRLIRLKKDPDLLMKASADGWKASEYILHHLTIDYDEKQPASTIVETKTKLI